MNNNPEFRTATAAARKRTPWLFITGIVVVVLIGLAVSVVVIVKLAHSFLSREHDAAANPTMLPVPGLPNPSNDTVQPISENPVVFSHLNLKPGPDCRMQTTSNTVAVSGEGRLSSGETFTPPFTIHAIAKTDITNIRLYYGNGMLILNWELNPHELRIHDPRTGGGFGVAGQGFLTVNEWHDLRWTIEPRGSVLVVDGVERARSTGDYSALQSVVGVGGSRGSTVTLKMFDVEPGSPLREK